MDENKKIDILKNRVYLLISLSVSFFILILFLGLCLITICNNYFPAYMKNTIFSKKEHGYAVSILRTLDINMNIGVVSIMKNPNGTGSLINGIISGLKPGRKHGLLILENMNSLILKESNLNTTTNYYFLNNFHFNPKKDRKHSCRNAENLKSMKKSDNFENHMGDLGNVIANEVGKAEINIVYRDVEMEQVFGRPIVLLKTEDICDEDRIEEPIENILAYGILSLSSQNEEEIAIYEVFEKKKVLRKMNLDISGMKNMTNDKKNILNTEIQFEKNDSIIIPSIDPLTPFLKLSQKNKEEISKIEEIKQFEFNKTKVNSKILFEGKNNISQNNLIYPDLNIHAINNKDKNDFFQNNSNNSAYLLLKRVETINKTETNLKNIKTSKNEKFEQKLTNEISDLNHHNLIDGKIYSLNSTSSPENTLNIVEENKKHLKRKNKDKNFKQKSLEELLQNFEKPTIIKKTDDHDKTPIINKKNSGLKLKPVSHMTANANSIPFSSNNEKKSYEKEIPEITERFFNVNDDNEFKSLRNNDYYNI